MVLSGIGVRGNSDKPNKRTTFGESLCSVNIPALSDAPMFWMKVCVVGFCCRLAKNHNMTLGADTTYNVYATLISVAARSFIG